VMDGGYLTAIRTAAGSAVATRELARADATTLGVFGTGVQAKFHVETIRRVRALTRVVVAATSADKAAAFAAWVTEATGLLAEVGTPEQASAADIVAVCTTSATAVVVAEAVRDGAHINAVGAFTPTTRELPGALIGRSQVYVDTRAGALSESGDLLLAVDEGLFALDRVVGEVGEVLLGTAPRRHSSAQVTVYKSVGAAFLDAATARLAYDQAGHRAVGTVYEFDAE
jgi:alanine dehydrogenase